ncbi:GTPase [Halomarina litorea]|uniref:GTPase n=1 Tax=Halomarina litorea TaxID=2961595 RepID=UPI0020C50C67|nr:GTPase [Halomarina sp. BCD28]
MRRAELRYQLPHLRAEIRTDEATEITRHDEEGKPIEDLKRRIDVLTRKLNRLGDDSGARHDARREAGFDLVALAGYTNAGKSTLMQRLADDLSVESGTHGDLAEAAGSADRLFETLGTTTRRATVGGRRLLVTDTVGFISDLPGWLVASFESTMGAVEHADVVCLVVDASDPVDRVEEKVATAVDHLGEAARMLPVLNKVDRVGEDHLDAVHETVGEAGLDRDPVACSATEGTGVGTLSARVRECLPERTTTLDVPNCGEAMSFVSWAYDHADVRDVTYRDGTVTVALAGRPAVVERAERRAADVERPRQSPRSRR